MSERSGVEAVMELLVAEEALRAQEDQDQAHWLSIMRAEGSAEALAAMERLERSQAGDNSEQAPIEIAEPSNPVVLTNPLEELVPVEPPEESKPQSKLFTWGNPVPPSKVAQPPVVEITLPEAEEESVIVEAPSSTGFSWFSQPEVEVEASEEVIANEIVEHAVVEDLEPVGSESSGEFEALLAAAAAEEELTVLEELEVRPLVASSEPENNVLIPSDEHRDRGPLSQLWIWLGLSSTAVPIILVWALLGLGLSASTTAVVLSLGFLASGILISVAAISGKRSGLSTGIISRSIYGVWGNSIPLTVIALSRVALTAIIIASFTYLLNGVENRIPDFKETIATVSGVKVTIGLVVQSIVLLTVSVLLAVRGSASRVIQTLISLLGFGLVTESILAIPGVGFSFTAAGEISLASFEAISGFALVIMVNLTLWFALAPNISKAIPMRVLGLRVFSAVLAANFFVPAVFGVIAIFWLGALTIGSNPTTIAEAATVLPTWAQGALTSGIAIAIIYAAMLSIKTASLDFIALFRIKGRIQALLISFFASFALLVLFAQQSSSQEAEYLVNLFILMGALSAGWMGIYIADVSIRKQAYHELSLARSYGLYKKFNIIALLTWFATLGVAVVTIPVNLLYFDFMGFNTLLVGSNSIANSALGFLATLLAGMILTYAIRIPQIKKQEREVLALESRREQLNDIFIGNE
jgi:purine-cytosine permease-like protein